MEVKSFQDSRNKELEEFQKRYQFLKSEYSSTLASAINESDANQQQILIQRVQQINKQLTEELHSIIGTLNKGSPGFSPKKLEDLTEELIKYQNDYSEIEKSNDKVKTLTLILNNTKENLGKAENMYYVYIGLLLILTVYICYLVFSSSFASKVVKPIAQIGSMR